MRCKNTCHNFVKKIFFFLVVVVICYLNLKCHEILLRRVGNKVGAEKFTHRERSGKTR